MNIVVCYKIVPDEQDAVVQADRTCRSSALRSKSAIMTSTPWKPARSWRRLPARRLSA